MNDLSWKLEDAIGAADDVSKSGARPEIRRGLIVAGVFFLGLLGWAALTPMDAGAVAQGIVAVSGNRQAVQNRDGGIVTSLSVSEGQLVKQGDLLLTVSASEVAANERGMAGELVNLYATRQRLRAERDGMGRVAVPPEFSTLEPEDEALAAEALRGQRQLFAARQSAIHGARGVIGQQIQQQHAQISAYRHQINSNRRQQELIQQELSGLKELETSGFVSKNRIRAMERGAAELDGNYGSFNADIAKSSEAIGEARMQIVSIERQRIEDVSTQLRDVQVRIDDVQPKLTALREQLKRASIRAPASGRVVGLSIHTVGGVIAPGQVLMEIVPLDRALVVEAKASPGDADDLAPGMETQIRFPALHERNIPILHGKVSKVSADSFEDERTGIKYFKIEVIVPPSELSKIGAQAGRTALKAGLPADVIVPLRKRTALSYLTEPITQMLWMAGREQ